MCHKNFFLKRNTHLSLRVMYMDINTVHIHSNAFMYSHCSACPRRGHTCLNHLNDTVYEVFNISYHKVTDYLNTHNEIILNNIKD